MKYKNMIFFVKILYLYIIYKIMYNGQFKSFTYGADGQFALNNEQRWGDSIVNNHAEHFSTQAKIKNLNHISNEAMKQSEYFQVNNQQQSRQVEFLTNKLNAYNSIAEHQENFYKNKIGEQYSNFNNHLKQQENFGGSALNRQYGQLTQQQQLLQQQQQALEYFQNMNQAQTNSTNSINQRHLQLAQAHPEYFTLENYADFNSAPNPTKAINEKLAADAKLAAASNAAVTAGAAANSSTAAAAANAKAMVDAQAAAVARAEAEKNAANEAFGAPKAQAPAPNASAPPKAPGAPTASAAPKAPVAPTASAAPSSAPPSSAPPSSGAPTAPGAVNNCLNKERYNTVINNCQWDTTKLPTPDYANEQAAIDACNADTNCQGYASYNNKWYKYAPMDEASNACVKTGKQSYCKRNPESAPSPSNRSTNNCLNKDKYETVMNKCQWDTTKLPTPDYANEQAAIDACDTDTNCKGYATFNNKWYKYAPMDEKACAKSGQQSYCKRK
jgi:hypothetical protein